jgi:transcriptional regulator of acetoin/glycerol metabolism
VAHRSEHAVPRGADPAQLARDLDGARDAFVSTGATGPAVRRLVADSWLRSLASGVDPVGTLARIRIEEAALAEIRAAHPLTLVMPVIRRLLVEDAADAGLLVAVSDAAGQLLYVEGASALRSLAEGMHFVPGADWSETSAGTNAPGTALALDRPVQIFGSEHLSRQVTPWSCSAAPIHDPETGAMLGVLDVTGGADVAGPHSLSLVRATGAAAEAELRLSRFATHSRSPGVVVPDWQAPRLDVLGKAGAVLTHGMTTTRLSLRHSEILMLLAGSEDGLNTGQLAVALSEDEQAAVTIRAEVSRMRHLLGPIELASRPYRLEQPLDTDAAAVRSALRSGEVRRAVAAYPGLVLPQSVAPAVIDVREDLHMEVRSALLASRDADALLSFADTAHGRDDFEIWARALEVLPASSPRHSQVEVHVAQLDADLG